MIPYDCMRRGEIKPSRNENILNDCSQLSRVDLVTWRGMRDLRGNWVTLLESLNKPMLCTLVTIPCPLGLQPSTREGTVRDVDGVSTKIRAGGDTREIGVD